MAFLRAHHVRARHVLVVSGIQYNLCHHLHEGKTLPQPLTLHSLILINCV